MTNCISSRSDRELTRMGHNSLRSSVIPAAPLGTRLAPPPNNRGLFLGCIRQVSRTQSPKMQSPKIEGDVIPFHASMPFISSRETARTHPPGTLLMHPPGVIHHHHRTWSAIHGQQTQCTRTLSRTSIYHPYITVYAIRTNNPHTHFAGGGEPLHT